MRAVFDTNVLISALLIVDSASAKALKLAEDSGTVLYSLPVLEEISEVLSRPKFRPYLDEKHIAEFLARIYRSWREIEIMHAIKACRDPKDDKFLELAVNGEAETIITGDKDLLDLHPFQTIQILTPARYLEEKGR